MIHFKSDVSTTYSQNAPDPSLLWVTLIPDRNEWNMAQPLKVNMYLEAIAAIKTADNDLLVLHASRTFLDSRSCKWNV